MKGEKMQKRALMGILMVLSIAFVLANNGSIGNFSFNNSLNDSGLNNSSNYSLYPDESVTLERTFIQEYSVQLIILVCVVLAISIYYLVFKINPENKTTYSPIFTKKNIGEMPAESFMKREHITFNEDEDLLEALELFVEESLFVIPVLKDSKIVGVLTKKDLIKRLKRHNYNFISKEKINKYITTEGLFFCKSEDKLANILELMKKNDVESIIVLDQNDNFKGTIDIHDIMKVFNRFHSTVKLKIENPPIMGPIMSKRFPMIDSRANIVQLRNILLKSKSNFAVVSENGTFDRIVTLKDILIAIYNSSDLSRTKVRNISPSVFAMNPGSLIFDSLKVYLFKHYNQIPLKVGGKVVGVAKLSDVNYEFYHNYIKAIEDM